MKITVMKNILNANQNKADEVRGVLAAKRVLMVNLIGSPGSGKTTLLEKTIAHCAGRFAIAVIEGDVATDRDARRLQPHNVPIVLINTDGACHLESISIQQALDTFDLDTIDIVFVENVGNLVCPAEFDIGEFGKVAVCSVTEGDDKPEKYPLLFREAKALVLNKIDLCEYTDFDMDAFTQSVTMLNGTIPQMHISCRREKGLDTWFAWLEETAGRVCRNP
ncbi:MAG: hydrogenase nickel incorporation protein HypB [Chitinivibrionales bacterium]|nr:hydrogenase nickel incorporation protein HypB [Chitinivibrionales bacterium]MBD3395373.1 hydrogenase nickel incorporation protein HypB [Chitinivibrionales bacterium]